MVADDELEAATGRLVQKLRGCDDFREGVASFRQKRKPQFGGTRRGPGTATPG